jgi:hypothetical protein
LGSHLAGEANRPGSFSKRTLSTVSDLDKRDAEVFTTLCRFGWRIGTAPYPSLSSLKCSRRWVAPQTWPGSRRVAFMLTAAIVVVSVHDMHAA